jgi:hypothetical protein
VVDILGFSIGSMVGQMIAHDRSDIVRRLVREVIFTNRYGHADDFWIDGFFTVSRAAKRSTDRVSGRRARVIVSVS